jgi:hypothetical protein
VTLSSSRSTYTLSIRNTLEIYKHSIICVCTS